MVDQAGGWYEPPKVREWLRLRRDGGVVAVAGASDAPVYQTARGKDYKLATYQDGRTVRVYASGTVIDHNLAGERGSLIEGAVAHRITSDNTHEKRLARIEKTKTHLREEIIHRVAAETGIAPGDAPEAYASAVGDLFGDVLAGRGDVNQRRLFLGWLGQVADLLPSEGQEAGGAVDVLAGAVARIAEAVRGGGAVSLGLGVRVEGGSGGGEPPNGSGGGGAGGLVIDADAVEAGD